MAPNLAPIIPRAVPTVWAVIFAALTLSGCSPRLERTLPGDIKGGYLNKERRSVLGQIKGRNKTAAPDEAANRVRQSVDVWFVKALGDGSQGEKFEFIPQARSYSCPSASERATADALEFAVTELIHGPDPATGLSSEIPLGTVLISVHDVHRADKGAKGGIVIDLSRHFLAGGGLDSMEARLEQLKRTVNGVASGEPVYLDVEGQRVTETPGDGIPVPQPLNKANPN